MQVVDEQNLETGNSTALDFIKSAGGYFLIALKQNLAGGRVDDISRGIAANNAFEPDRNCCNPMLKHFLDRGLGVFAVSLDNDLTGLRINNVNRRFLECQQVRINTLGERLVPQEYLFTAVVVVQKLLGRIAKRLKQDRGRHLAATVDTDVKNIFVVKLKIKPGTTVRDDPGRIEHLAAGMGFSFVMVIKHAGRTMQLADNNPLGSVDDKRAVICHQRNFAKIDLLLLDILDRPDT